MIASAFALLAAVAVAGSVRKPGPRLENTPIVPALQVTLTNPAVAFQPTEPRALPRYVNHGQLSISAAHRLDPTARIYYDRQGTACRP